MCTSLKVNFVGFVCVCGGGGGGITSDFTCVVNKIRFAEWQFKMKQSGEMNESTLAGAFIAS